MKNVFDRLVSRIAPIVEIRSDFRDLLDCGKTCASNYFKNCTTDIFDSCVCSTPNSDFTCCVMDECRSYLYQDEVFNWMIDGCKENVEKAPATFSCTTGYHASWAPSSTKSSSTKTSYPGPSSSPSPSAKPSISKTASRTVGSNSGPTSSSRPSSGVAALRKSRPKGLSGGAKAGVAIAVILLLALFALIAFMIWRRRRNRAQSPAPPREDDPDAVRDDDLNAVRATYGAELPTKANTHEAPGEIPHAEKGFYAPKIAALHGDAESGTMGVPESVSPPAQKISLPGRDAAAYIPPPRGEFELPAQEEARIIDVQAEGPSPNFEMGSDSPALVAREAAPDFIDENGEFLKWLGTGDFSSEVHSGLQTGLGTGHEPESDSGAAIASNENSDSKNQEEVKEAKVAALQEKLAKVRLEKEKLTRLQELEKLEEELKAEVMTAMRSS